MKKSMITLLLATLAWVSVYSQDMESAVARLDKAGSVPDYETLEKEFTDMAAAQKTAWLPYYYAAYCNAQIGFLYEHDGERIEPYSNRGEEQAKQALALLDTATQQKELSEVYTVLSKVYRTKVFINPQTYGRKFGILSDQMMKRALKLNPDNPRAILVNAWVKYHTPKTWGGDKALAKKLATESLEKLASAPNGAEPHWGKAEAEAILNDHQ